MTPEDKKLLVKDLCCRLPYNVVINCTEEDDERTNFNCFLTASILGDIMTVPMWICKPYLRPMSSMTEAELKEFISITENVLVVGEKLSTVILSNDATDWLNAHHFDYRGLIEKGLALKAVDGIY